MLLKRTIVFLPPRPAAWFWANSPMPQIVIATSRGTAMRMTVSRKKSQATWSSTTTMQEACRYGTQASSIWPWTSLLSTRTRAISIAEGTPLSDFLVEDLAGERDGLDSVILDVPGKLLEGHFFPDVRQFQKHGEIDAGDHLHLSLLEKGKGDIRWGPSEEIGKDKHPLSLVEFSDCRADLFLHLLDPLGLVDGDMNDPLEAAPDQFRRLDHFASQIAVGRDQHAYHDFSPLWSAVLGYANGLGINCQGESLPIAPIPVSRGQRASRRPEERSLRLATARRKISSFPQISTLVFARVMAV